MPDSYHPTPAIWRGSFYADLRWLPRQPSVKMEVLVKLLTCEAWSMLRRILLIAFILSIAAGLLTGCGSASTKTPAADHDLPMAPMSMMPEEVKSAPVVTQQAYQFAVANPDVMQHIPCYCGCGSMGHTSNYACYVESVAPDNKVKFDLHAIGCSICVDITQDVMRLLREGKSPQEARTYVDATYAKYGPSNIPE